MSPIFFIYFSKETEIPSTPRRLFSAFRQYRMLYLQFAKIETTRRQRSRCERVRRESSAGGVSLSLSVSCVYAPPEPYDLTPMNIVRLQRSGRMAESKGGASECVVVAVRRRPMNAREISQRHSEIVSVDGCMVTVKNPRAADEEGRGGRDRSDRAGKASKAFLLREKSFTFDMVFDEHSEQEAVYNEWPTLSSKACCRVTTVQRMGDWERQDVTMMALKTALPRHHPNSLSTSSRR